MEHKFIHGFLAPFHSETNFRFGELTRYWKQQQKNTVNQTEFANMQSNFTHRKTK